MQGEAEVPQHFFQRAGKFADGDGFAVQLFFEIMKDGRGGMVQHLGIKMAAGIADEFNRDHLRRAGDAFTVVELEDQAVGLQRDHLAASSFWTSWTKSVASAKRR